MGKSTRLCYQLTCKGVGKGGGGRSPPDFKLMHVTRYISSYRKRTFKNKRGKKTNSFQAISSMYKNQSLEVSKYMNYMQQTQP